MKRNDALWKGILEDLFEDFLQFFYPEAVSQFDFGAGFDFLDKELEVIFPGNDQENPRFVDKLARVYTKDGTDNWILVHIEVQGSRDKRFEERMFTYFYRIFERYHKPVAAIAILSDVSRIYHPKSFEWNFLGTEIRYSFKAYKILNQEERELKESLNPFAIVILTVLLALKKGRFHDDQILNLKFDLAKHLIKKQIHKTKIHALMNFLRFYVRFKENEKDLIFEEKLNQLTGKTYPMGIEQILREQAISEGLKKGIKQGIEKGMEKGLQKGIKKGIKKGMEKGMEKGIEKGIEQTKVEVILNAQKKGLPITLIAELVNISEEEIKQILHSEK